MEKRCINKFVDKENNNASATTKPKTFVTKTTDFFIQAGFKNSLSDTLAIYPMGWVIFEFF